MVLTSNPANTMIFTLILIVNIVQTYFLIEIISRLSRLRLEP